MTTPQLPRAARELAVAILTTPPVPGTEKARREALALADTLDPTDWRSQHSPVETRATATTPGRGGLIARPRIDNLLASGTIDAAQWTAASRLYRDYSVAFGASAPAAGGGGSSLLITEQRVQAAHGYRGAVQALGPIASTIVLPVVLLDWSIAAAATRARMSPRVASQTLRDGLDRVADRYSGNGAPTRG